MTQILKISKGDETMDQKNIGHRIKQRREQIGLSMQDIADKLDVNRSSVMRWENGETNKIKLPIVEKLAQILQTSPDYLMGYKDEVDASPGSAFVVLDHKKIRMIPLYNSVSAGFGALAVNYIEDYVPCLIEHDAEAEQTICIQVQGDSMFPKIEDGDVIQVRKQTSVESGALAVVLLDKTEGMVKKVVYGKDWIELHSINPMYPVRRFEGKDVTRISVVGLVRKIIKNV